MGTSWRGLALVAAAGLAAAGCPDGRKQLLYDLAARTPFAERWSAREVLLFGTPGAEPQLAEGFHREGAGGGGERFLWSKGEAEVALSWPEVRDRAAIVDLAPYRGVKGQRADVRLNGTSVARFALNDLRHRYRLPLPASAQRAGINRLRFVFGAEASPSDVDPANPDKRRLAAAFHSLVVGGADDAALDDLLARDAPSPFSSGARDGIPFLVQLGPSVVRYALRLPVGAELRFTPELHPAARASSSSASFRVTVESAAGEEREVWSRVLRGAEPGPQEVRVRLPGDAGQIVRLGLHVGGASSERFAWARWTAPRILGQGSAASLTAPPLAAADDGRAASLRKSLAGANVLLVILDAARAQQFGTYGYARSTTPEIDRIAAEGVVFENAFTPAVYTLAAMPSIWTSQHPDRHHSEVSFSARLPKDRLTLAELLSVRGIATAAFVANAVAGRAFGFDRGFSEFNEYFHRRAEVFREVVPPWLRANRERRFFAYLHFREPHFPYDPPPPFDTKFGPHGPIPAAARGDSEYFKDVNQGRRPFGPEAAAHLARLYDGNLAYADQEVGALRGALEAEGLWDRTVVIVAADHGEALFEHGWIGHNVQLYEESIHVPLVVRFPAGKGPAGLRVKALADLLDLAPTIADVFGVLGQGGSDREFQGQSLLPVVAGAPGKPAILSRTVWDRPIYAVRDERFKLLYNTRTGESALYDLAEDPRESRDVAAREPLRAAYYREALHDWIARLGERVRPAGEEAQLTSEQCENLRSLGYADARCR